MPEEIVYNAQVKQNEGRGYTVKFPDIYGPFLDLTIEELKDTFELRHDISILIDANYISQGKPFPEPKYQCRKGSEDFPIIIRKDEVDGAFERFKQSQKP